MRNHSLCLVVVYFCLKLYNFLPNLIFKKCQKIYKTVVNFLLLIYLLRLYLACIFSRTPRSVLCKSFFVCCLPAL